MQWSLLLLQVRLFVPCTAAVKQYTAKKMGGAHTVHKFVGMAIVPVDYTAVLVHVMYY